MVTCHKAVWTYCDACEGPLLNNSVTWWSFTQVPGLGVGRICIDKAMDEAMSPLASGYMGG